MISGYAMRIGVVRTKDSPCRCAESVSVGLRALGHEIVLADSEEIEARALALASTCDLVLDHTDTFRGRGMYRPLVRLLLENCGAAVIGPDAAACFLADNKAAAKRKLADSGIPVPPGILIRAASWELPAWLRPPLVLKPAFEHMSRGVRVARSEPEAREAASELLETLRQPILVETFIPGRELAVSLLEGPDGLEALPVLEWVPGGGGADILTECFKLMDPQSADRGVARAALSSTQARAIDSLARRAFLALGLRDYGRFDLRLSPEGTPFFLEANTTPSLEPMEALAVSAEWAGLDYAALVARMISSAARRHAGSKGSGASRLRVSLSAGSVELEIPRGVPAPPESSVELARCLDVRPGERVLDLGCGSGLLSIAAAKMGAGSVAATDLDPRALDATGRNSVVNGVADRITLHAGSWFGAVGGAEAAAARFDVILATPPQTPGPYPFGPKYGGPEGTDHLFQIVRDAVRFLEPARGRLWLMAISLANPEGLMARLRETFSDVRLERESGRSFLAAEYEAFGAGLFDHLCRLRASGLADFSETGDGRCAFRNLFLRASGPRDL